MFFSTLFFSIIQTQDDIIQISPALRPPPTLITFGVVTLAIALVGLITLTLAAAVTLATLTRPRGLVSGRSIRTPPIRGHNIIEIYGLSVPPMPPLSLGETMAILMEKPTQTPRGPCLLCLCGPTGFTSLRTLVGSSLPTQAWRPGAGPILGSFQTNVTEGFVVENPKKR